MLIRPSPENALRLQNALAEFGFTQLGLKQKDFVSEGQVIQLGVAPNRIDVLTSITGCGFDEVLAESR